MLKFVWCLENKLHNEIGKKKNTITLATALEIGFGKMVILEAFLSVSSALRNFNILKLLIFLFSETLKSFLFKT